VCVVRRRRRPEAHRHCKEAELVGKEEAVEKGD
jgi:hypothetical protein